MKPQTPPVLWWGFGPRRGSGLQVAAPPLVETGLASAKDQADVHAGSADEAETAGALSPESSSCKMPSAEHPLAVSARGLCRWDREPKKGNSGGKV